MEKQLYSLKLCVEKSLSKSNVKLVEESFKVPIETFSFATLPGVYFKEKIKGEYENDYYDGEEYGVNINIPGTYTGGVYTPIPGLKYDFNMQEDDNYKNYENFNSSTTGAGDFSTTPGTNYGFSPHRGTEYGFSPHRGTEYGFSVLPGIVSTETTTEQEEPPEVIATFNFIKKNSLKNLEVMQVYLLNKFGPNITKEILESVMLNKLKNQSLTDVIMPKGIHYGSQHMLDVVGSRILDGWEISSYTLGYDVYPDYVGTLVMTKPNNSNFTQIFDFGVPLQDFSQGVRASLSIPTSSPAVSSLSTSVSSNLYDLKKSLSTEQLIEYEKQFEDVFGALSTQDEEIKHKRKILELEEKGKVTLSRPIASSNIEQNTPIILQRVQNFVDQGIFELANPDLGLVKSMIKREFFVRKVTISFGEEGNVKKTPLVELEGVRDNEGNIIEIDPIEYKIRDLTPINAVKTVLRERLFPLVNLKFEFLDEKIQEGFDLLESGVIRIGFNPKGGCWSMIGMDNFFSQEEFTMNLGWLDASTIMHEFCHFLGLIHEHQLPIGKTIQWDEPVVYEWAKVVHGWTEEETYTNIIKKYEINSINGIDYDPFSIMHYFFPPQLTIDKKGSRQNLRLSVEDIKFVMSLFPGKDLDYRTFYQQIYGIHIEDDSNWFPNLIKILAFLIFIYIIYRIYKKLK